MWEQDTLTSGINDETLSSSTNDENIDDDLSDDIDDEDDDGWDDDQDQNQKVDWKKKFYATTNLQNRKLQDLTKELASLKNSKNLSEDDLAKFKEKYDEEDLELIQKIIEQKTNDLLDKRQSVSLEQKELNIFLKEHPELSEPELKHIRAMQKDYWYSLKKAYSIVFWKGDDTPAKKKPSSVSDSFGGDKTTSKSQDKRGAEDKAYKDMEAYL